MPDNKKPKINHNEQLILMDCGLRVTDCRVTDIVYTPAVDISLKLQPVP
jgi:hypothetical protein